MAFECKWLISTSCGMRSRRSMALDWNAVPPKSVLDPVYVVLLPDAETVVSHELMRN